MDFFNVLSEKANNFANKIYKNSTKLVEATKLSLELSDTESKLSSAYAELGKKYYDEVSSGNQSFEFEEDLTLINDLKDKVFEITEKIDEIKQKKRCACCGNVISVNDAFCKSCGCKIEQ